MIDFLLGVPGKLKTLTDLLNSTWAAKLDTLATRLSATWAAKLDTLAADYTTAKAAYLDAAISTRAAATTPLLKAPLAGGIPGAAGRASSSLGTLAGCESLTISDTTYQVAVNYTGAGVLNFCNLQKTDASADTVTLRVTVDGNVTTVTSPTTQYGCNTFAGIVTNGGAVAMDQIPFSTSLKIEAKRDAGTSSGALQFRYRKTA